MAYFNEKFLNFFKSLEKNNSKEWFDENRKTYDNEVRAPFKHFTQEMIRRLKPIQPNINEDPNKAIFRINRDIRFSKDKSPYKTHMAANIGPGGRKSMEDPGFYFQFSHENLMLAGGAYQPTTQGLLKIRSYIAENLQEFRKIINDKPFKEKYGEVKGEKNKRVPSEFLEDLKKEPLLANKQFYFMTFLPASEVTKDSLPETLTEYFKAGEPFNGFIAKALQR